MPGVVNTTDTFTTNQVITSTLMNNIIDQTLFTSDALANSTLALTAGKMKVATSGITSTEMGVDAVTTNAIANGSVTPAKLSTYGPTWDSGTLSLYQHGFEVGTGITSDSVSFIDFHSSFPVIDFNARIIRESGINNVLTIANVGTSPIKLQASGGVKFADAVMPNPAGTAPIYGVRAWVNFDGTTADNIGGTYSRTLTTVTVTTSVDHGLIVGHKVFLDFTSGIAVDGAFVVTGVTSSTIFTVTHGTSGTTSGNVTLNRRLIRASGNVSSVSLLDTGEYAVNFTVALPNANYARSGFANFTSSSTAGFVGGNSTTNTTQESCDINVANSGNGVKINTSVVNVIFVG